MSRGQLAAAKAWSGLRCLLAFRRLQSCISLIRHRFKEAPQAVPDQSGALPIEYWAGQFSSRIFSRERSGLNTPVGKSPWSRVLALNIIEAKYPHGIFRARTLLQGDLPTGVFSRERSRLNIRLENFPAEYSTCLLYTSPSPRD